MTPAARVQSAIEILDLVIAAARGNGAPADRIVADWFRPRRFAGSSDRRAVRELVYTAIRTCGERPATGRAAMLLVAQRDSTVAALFDGTNHAPPPLMAGEPVAAAGVAPRWLETMLGESGMADAEAAALLERAPLDVRVNALKAERSVLALPVPGEPTAAPQGLRFPFGTNVEQWPAFAKGMIEVQDTGSQLVCVALGVSPGETVVDLCAGAGGKTLALAAAMENRGTLVACDTDRARLSRLAPRAERAGAMIAQTVLLDPGRELAALGAFEGRADAVLVDAPCSGTGTWRRNPEARWRLGETQLSRLVETQRQVLDVAAALVCPGGRIVYATCSVLDCEGAGQVDAFLARHPDWSAEPPAIGAGTQRGAGLRLTPARDSTDGFFIARLARS
jgi:16S rRNA (cytosine967-C5)-methyltransferase